MSEYHGQVQYGTTFYTALNEDKQPYKKKKVLLRLEKHMTGQGQPPKAWHLMTTHNCFTLYIIYRD
ncbi:hypothetical protein ACJX0J_011193, partial [Zea mays]